MSFYKYKSMVVGKVDLMIKDAIIKKKVITINDFLRELGAMGAGEKMIRDRISVYVNDGYVVLEKHKENRNMDKIIPAGMELS